MEPSYPPFELTNEKGEIIGFDVDIANAICKEIQANCSFKGQAFDGLVQAVKQNVLMRQSQQLILPKRVQNKWHLLIRITIVQQVLLR
ncbi:amino acid ABC transporter periplasmic protein [Actinobacillus equuli]|nr:amino acid ABC transporter periplasmic protein [Actinobacillus equuli]